MLMLANISVNSELKLLVSQTNTEHKALILFGGLMVFLGGKEVLPVSFLSDQVDVILCYFLKRTKCWL